jgi:hypothetical protein
MDTVTNTRARVVQHARPTLDEVIVFDVENGAEIDSTVVPPEPAAPGVWDRRLLSLGFERTTRWFLRGRQFVCSVAPKQH